FVFDFLYDLFDPRRMNTAVGDQPFDCLFRDFAAIWIEARKDDRAGRVVDDQIDAGRELERANVPPLASDDATLQVVARQIDNRDGRLHGVFAGAPLNRLRDVVFRAIDGRFAGLRIEPLQQI